MKKILLIVFVTILAKFGYAQYPVQQYLGSDSSLVNPRGALKSRLVVYGFTDTTQANTQRISQYAGALIYTTGTDKVWYRNSTATGWIEFTSSGGTTTNIYNSDGFITGTRVLDLSASPLTFSRSGVKQFAAEDNLTTIGSPNNQKRITVYNDSITILGLSQTTDTTTYKPLAIDADGYFTIMDRWPGGSTPTLQQVLTAGSTLTGVNDIHLDGNEFRFLGGSGDFLVQDVNLIDLINDNDNGIQIGTAEGVLIRPNVGVLKIDSLNYTLSTTGKKVLIRDTATGLVQNIDPSLLGGGTPTLQQVLTAGSTLTTDNTIDAGTTVFKIGQSGERQLIFDPVTKYWAIGDYAGDFGNAVSIHLSDSNGTVRIDGDLQVQGMVTSNLSSSLNTVFPIFYNSSSQYHEAGSGIDTIWRLSDSIHFRVRSVHTSKAGTFGIYAPTAGASYTFTNGLTNSSGTVKLGGALTQNTSITNASNYDYKLSLSEDGDNVGFIGTTYSSLLGFENGSGWLRMGSSTYSGVQVVSTSGNLLSVNTGTTRGSNVEVKPDEILINPSVGLLKIDTLTSAVGTKALRYNPTTGLVSYADTTTGGSGGTPAGNYGNLQLNRNGAFATPASDSLIWASATGLTSLGNIGVGVTTSTHRLSILDNQTVRDVLKIRNLSSSGYSSIGFFGYTDAQTGGFGYANGGIAGPVSDAIYFYSNTKDLVFSKDATATSSMTIRGATGTVGIVNAFIGSATGTATARLHISAGTATASTAPLKFTSGTNLTTAEAGAMEYNGTNLFFTPSSAARNNILMTASVNSVSPTSPNRTITVVVDGVTLYIHAKTTND